MGGGPGRPLVVFAGSVAADSSHAQQDQAFLKELAQPAAPMSVFVSPEQEQPPVVQPGLQLRGKLPPQEKPA